MINVRVSRVRVKITICCPNVHHPNCRPNAQTFVDHLFTRCTIAVLFLQHFKTVMAQLPCSILQERRRGAHLLFLGPIHEETDDTS